MMRKKIIAVLLCACMLFTAGCWDRRELNELGIVLALAIDKKDQGEKIRLTVQVVRVGELKKDSGGRGKSVVELLSAKGDTIFDAVRNLSKTMDRRAYFAHLKVIIVDEAFAREGILPILDFVSRSRELRRLTWIVVAKDGTAQEMLSVQHGLEDLQASYLENIILKREVASEACVSNVLDFLKMLPGNGVEPVTGVMEITLHPTFPLDESGREPSEGARLSGAAVFDKDKLAGYLDEKEARSYNIVTGKAGISKIDIPFQGENGELISIEMSKAGGKIKPQVKEGKISFKVDINIESAIAMQESTTKISELKTLEQLDKIQEQTVKKDVEETIEKVRNELKLDIFGFGSKLKERYPKEWEKVKEDWNQIFSEVEYTVEVKNRIHRTGLLQKPIKEDEE